jgi:hypothetical protein
MSRIMYLLASLLFSSTLLFLLLTWLGPFDVSPRASLVPVLSVFFLGVLVGHVLTRYAFFFLAANMVHHHGSLVYNMNGPNSKRLFTL